MIKSGIVQYSITAQAHHRPEKLGSTNVPAIPKTKHEATGLTPKPAARKLKVDGDDEADAPMKSESTMVTGASAGDVNDKSSDCFLVRARAPEPDTESAGARHRERRGLTHRAPGPDTESTGPESFSKQNETIV